MSRSKRKKQRPRVKLVMPQTGLAIPEDAIGGVNVPQNLVRVIATHQSFTGPLPPPAILHQYDQVLAGAADRILTMAESQTKHRIGLEGLVVRSDVRKSYIGQGAAFIIAMTGFGIGGWLIYSGHDAAGSACVGTPLLGLVGVFITGNASRREERKEKTKIMTGKK